VVDSINLSRSIKDGKLMINTAPLQRIYIRGSATPTVMRVIRDVARGVARDVARDVAHFTPYEQPNRRADENMII
jgi:hypothetical protein